jgi:hypothetical protein
VRPLQIASVPFRILNPEASRVSSSRPQCTSTPAAKFEDEGCRPPISPPLFPNATRPYPKSRCWLVET